MTTFVSMFHPNLPGTIVDPVRVAEQAIDEQYARGWLLVDPDEVLPAPSTPYYTTAAADSRFLKIADTTNPASAFSVAQRAALGAVFAPLAGTVEAQPMWATGHSWISLTNSSASNGGRVHERVASRLHMGAITNRAVSGRSVCDIANLSLSGANAWAPRAKVLAVVCCLINDLREDIGGLGKPRRGFKLAWRALLSQLTANAAVASNTSSFAYSSTAAWTSEAVTGTSASPGGATVNSTGGTRWKTSTVGAYFDTTFTGTDLDLFLVARAAGAGLVTFTEGGTTLGTLDLTQPVYQDCPAVFRVRGLASGTHTIRGTLTSGASLTVDSYRVPSTAPTVGVVLGEPPVIKTGADYASYLTDFADFKADLAAVVAEFPSFIYVDGDQPGWDQATMLVADGKHPNDYGAAFLATLVTAALSKLPPSPALGTTLNQNYPAAYAIPAAPALPSGGVYGAPPPPPPPTLPFSDDFNRADASTLGVTSVGSVPWSIVLGTGMTAATAGIVSNQARILSRTGTGSGWTMAAVDTGVTDHTFTAQVGGTVGSRHAIVFSMIDGTNFLALYRAGVGSCGLVKRIGDVDTAIATIAADLPNNGTVIAAVHGTTVTISINGTQVYTGTVADRPMGTKVGIGQGSSTAYDAAWDNIQVAA